MMKMPAPTAGSALRRKNQRDGDVASEASPAVLAAEPLALFLPLGGLTKSELPRAEGPGSAADRTARRVVDVLRDHARQGGAAGATPFSPSGLPVRRSLTIRRGKVTPQVKGGTAAAKGGVGREPYPHVRVVGGERVRLRAFGELAEAKRIVASLKGDYHINLNSKITIEAIEAGYKNAPQDQKDQLKVTVWEVKELRGILAAAKNFSAILGPQRAQSTLATKAQGVTTVGRLKAAIDRNTPKGKLDTTTYAETFVRQRNIGFFNPGTELVEADFFEPGGKPNNEISLTATAIHEMTHALIEPYELRDWINRLAYWRGPSEKSKKPNAEPPPTSYGKMNAAEDLCESVAIYFVNRENLKKRCPIRTAFIGRVVAGWTAPTVSTVIQTAVISKAGCSKNPVLVGS